MRGVLEWCYEHRLAMWLLTDAFLVFFIGFFAGGSCALLQARRTVRALCHEAFMKILEEHAREATHAPINPLQEETAHEAH